MANLTARWLGVVATCYFAGAAGVCIAQVPQLPGDIPALAPPSGAAKVMTVQGNVSVSRDSQAWAVEEGSWIQPQQEIISGDDGYALLEVSDGSRFEIFPNSRIVFRQNAGNLRELLDIWIGRVKIHIHRLNGQPNHNRIRTPTAVISVRGTIFDVTVDPDDEMTFVLVEEGSVAVQHAILPFSDAKILNAGEYLRVYKNSPLARKSFDRGAALQRALRAASDLLIFKGPRIGGGGGGTTVGAGGGLPGDSKDPTPPPPPPPPDN